MTDIKDPRSADSPDGDVVKNLRERYSRLNEVLSLYDGVQPRTDSPDSPNRSELDARYRIAVTDLFVEYALDLLKKKADQYQRWGYTVYTLGVLFIFIGIAVAAIQMFWPSQLLRSDSSSMPPTHAATTTSIAASAALTPTGGTASTTTSAHPPEVSPWLDLLSRFVRAFTFYGLLVLAAVKTWQFGKALLDQSERLFERRHALRQGRLFVHLKHGEVSIDEMDRVFAWNLDQPNAFASIMADAKAPWGAALAEFTKILPELLKIGADSAKKEK